MVGYDPIDVGSIPSFSTIYLYLCMADFIQAYQVTLAHEGGYSNNPQDSGGETYKGIARKYHSDWVGWHIIDQLKKNANFPKNLDDNKPLQDLVMGFYKKEFWDKMKLDSVTDQRIANEMFDTAVNMGLNTAGRFLQRVLNVSNKGEQYYPNLKVDGIIGLGTITALNKHPMPDTYLKD
jgi:lysozyme family protein